ncbi:MAG: SUF system NifU family Fe-S cluster assembly protein [bacterium]|nr:SUF system NifU family Fe-S cluster assembly protein [bacterium]
MDLYSEIILDYYKNPRNKGTLDKATNVATEYNPLCGDRITIDLEIKEGKVNDIKFSGEGCAISQSATSMLTEQLIGKSTKEIAKLDKDYIMNLLNIPISPGRIKCALLGLATVKKALTTKTDA